MQIEFRSRQATAERRFLAERGVEWRWSFLEMGRSFDCEYLVQLECGRSRWKRQPGVHEKSRRFQYNLDWIRLQWEGQKRHLSIDHVSRRYVYTITVLGSWICIWIELDFMIVDCAVSNWTNSSCSATCGNATYWMGRKILQRSLNGGVACPLDYNYTFDCGNLGPCPIRRLSSSYAHLFF